MNIKQKIKQNRALFYIIRDIAGFTTKYRMKRLHSKGVKNKVVFNSFSGSQYSDNPRAICEAVHELDKTIELVWLLKKEAMMNPDIPAYVRVVEYTEENIVNELSDSKVWIDNSFIFAYACNKLFKGNNQLYIQTWHGDRGFKKCGYEWNGFTSDTRGIENGFCDVLLIGSEFEKRFFERAYRYKGEYLFSGSPRDDCLVNRDYSKEEIIRSRLGIDNDTNILLYAPTYRDDGNDEGIQKFIGSINEILRACEQYKVGKWICFYRGHHLEINGLDINNSANFKNVSFYPDMSDLLCVSQILVTDYSSSAGDFIVKGEPVILFQVDRDNFTGADRQLLFDVDKSPFLVAKSVTELTSVLKSLKKINIQQNCKDILTMYQAYEPGNASQTVANKILEFIYK